MANLAVHPFNKHQIIDNSLHLFYTILESNMNENLTCYVRNVLDRWGFSDVGSTTNSEQWQKEKEIGLQIKSEQHNDDDAKKSANNMQMLDNLQCILSECDSFGTNDVMEIISAVKRIVSDKTSGRHTLLKHMAMHEWPGLLVRIISDVWKPVKEVYTDEVLWSILTDTIDTMITYSDACVECADILIEHGALAMMQEIADAYYQHFKQKIIALNYKVSEYRGENSGELRADDNRRSKDPTKTNILSGQPGTDEYLSKDMTTQTNIPSGQQGADGHQSMGQTQANIPKQQGADVHQSMGPTHTNIPSGQQGADGHQSMGPTQTNIPKQQGADVHQSMGPTQANIPKQQGADVHQSMGPTQANIPKQQGADEHQSMGPTQTNVPKQQGADVHQSMGLTQANIPSGQKGADEHQSMGPTQANIPKQQGADVHQSMGPTQANIPSGQKEADGHQSVGLTQANIPSGQQGADVHQSMGPTQANIPSGQQGADDRQSMGLTQANIPRDKQGADERQSMGPTQANIPSKQQGAEGHQSVDLTLNNSVQLETSKYNAIDCSHRGKTDPDINNISSSKTSQEREVILIIE
ncbi:uncharacterized protein LOC117120939 isoform X2 [Anneissia japonica]|uniref:uncharacterized protein LOC117120939 isoform X2 n=1 Tax=Anneissia japonica TaxID=1529436 RepID=UPI0014255F12|nr:uncharacterized protein LOC117120939 isoform X2 [Anneissia japonica]